MNEFNEKVDVLQMDDVNKYNEPQYSYYLRDVDCRLEEVTEMIKEDKGEDLVSDAMLFVGDVDIMENDRIETEDGETYEVIQVDTLKDLDGSIHHKELKLRYTDES